MWCKQPLPSTRGKPGCPAPGLTLQTRLRKAIYDSIHAFIAQHNLTRPKDVIDLGCSVGVSTRWLAADFPDAQVGWGGVGGGGGREG